MSAHVEQATQSGAVRAHPLAKSSHARWTDEQITMLRRLRAASLTKREIADQMPGRTLQSIDNACLRFGIPVGEMLAERLYEQAQQRAWANEKDQELMAFWAAGMHQDDIGGKLGRTPSAVLRRLDRLRAMGHPVARRVGGPRPGTVQAKNIQTSQKREVMAQVVVVLIDRNCLHCFRRFQAKSRFLRLCEYCRNQA